MEVRWKQRNVISVILQEKIIITKNIVDREISPRSGGAVYTSQAAVKMEKCNLFYNSAIDMTGTTGQYWFGGGALLQIAER